MHQKQAGDISWVLRWIPRLSCWKNWHMPLGATISLVRLAITITLKLCVCLLVLVESSVQAATVDLLSMCLVQRCLWHERLSLSSPLRGRRGCPQAVMVSLALVGEQRQKLVEEMQWRQWCIADWWWQVPPDWVKDISVSWSYGKYVYTSVIFFYIFVFFKLSASLLAIFMLFKANKTKSIQSM